MQQAASHKKYIFSVTCPVCSLAGTITIPRPAYFCYKKEKSNFKLMWTLGNAIVRGRRKPDSQKAGAWSFQMERQLAAGVGLAPSGWRHQVQPAWNIFGCNLQGLVFKTLAKGSQERATFPVRGLECQAWEVFLVKGKLECWLRGHAPSIRQETMLSWQHSRRSS